MFNCGGKECLNDLTFNRALRDWFSSAPFADSWFCSPLAILAGYPFPFKNKALYFSSLLTLGFSIVSVLFLHRIVTSELLKVCMAMGWCLHWGLQEAFREFVVLFQICRYDLSTAIKREF